MNAKRATKARLGAAIDCCKVNSAYCDVNKNLKAQCFYLYHVKPSETSYKEVRVYVTDRGAHIPHDKVEDEIKKILEEIKSNKLQPCAWSLGGVRWTRRSYLVVLFEDSKEKLVPCDAVRFTCNQYPYENHAFGDGKDFAISNDISGFFCLNHMWKRNKDPVGNPGEDFHMVVNHAKPSPLLKILSHEDTGTNMGPPIGPP